MVYYWYHGTSFGDNLYCIKRYINKGNLTWLDSQVNQVMDGGPPDQDPVMASPIPRPEFENLWNVIKRKMDVHKPPNQTELLEFLCQEWHKVTQHQCERLVESIPSRMKGVIKNQGYSTKYWFKFNKLD